MGVKENKELIRRLYEEGFPGNPDGLDRYFTTSYEDHSLWNDLSGLKTALKAFRSAYPSVEWKVEDLVGEGEKVAVRSTMKVGSATGNYRTLGATAIYRFESGRIAESWGHGDPLF